MALVGGAQIGVEMEGAESSWIGFPGTTDLDYLKSHGVDLVRLPISWEMMQNTLNGPLNQTYLNGLETFLSQAAARGMQVVIEVDNDGEYDVNWQQYKAAHGIFSSALDIGQAIGSTAVPISSFVNFWTQLSTALNGHAGVAGYDLMNEPAYISGSTWQTAAQAAVNAIRTVDTHTTLYVEGSTWSAANTWTLPGYSPNFHVSDPANNLVYEAHQYFDNGSGLYQQAFNPQVDYANMGVDLLQPWLNWLHANNAKGFLGEFGIAVNNPQWLPILNAVLNDLQVNGISGTYCNYTYNQSANISIDPQINQGAAAMELIFEYTAPSIAGYVPVNGTGSNGTTTANVLTLTGTGASYCKVNVYDGGVLVGTTTSNITGAWSLTTATLTNGAHNFTATNIDAAGNSSESSFTLAVTVSATSSVTVNTATVISPIITSFSPDSSGTSGNGTADANHITLMGDAQAGTTVQVFDGATLIGTVTADPSWQWSFATGTLSNGVHIFTSKAVDATGNISAASAALNVTVDAVPPAVTVDTTVISPIITSFSPDSSGTAGSGTADANHITLMGDAQAGTTVQIFDGGTLIGTVTANSSWQWSFATGTLSNGVHVFTSNATDAAGNVSAASAALNVTVDTAAPVAPVVIEASGSIELMQVGNNYFLDPVAGGTGPELHYQGSLVTAGEFGAWTPIGAEATSSGYEVALFNASTHLYTVWNTDSSGDVMSASIANVSGTSTALESIEVSFHQDLNGDGIIGPPTTTTTIEASGSISLVEVGTNFYLDSISSGTGHELMYGGAPMTAGEFGAWTPIGAEATSSGYEVALFNASTHLYTVWNTDSSGNVTSASIANVSGTSTVLESIEVSFHQDLNGDGFIDTASTVIEASGSLTVGLSHVVQPSAIDAGNELEITGIDSGSVTFKAVTGTLVLDHSMQFTGSIIGLTGDGTPAHSDEVDLKDISYGAGTTVSYSGNASGGTLTVTDAQNHAAHLSLVGNYTNSTFNLSSDGNGGTMVVDPPKDGFPFASMPTLNVSASQPSAARLAGDGFVFVGGTNATGSGPEHGTSTLDLHSADDNAFHQVLVDLHHFMLH